MTESKNIPELRFPGFTGEWEEKKLGEEFGFIKNYSYSRNDEGEGNYYHIHYGDIHSKYNSYIDADTKLPSIKSLDEHITLDELDIILADASEDYKDLGKATLLKKKSNRNIIAGLHTFALRIKNTKNIDAKYFLYYTKTDKYRKYMSKVGTGTSVFGINKKNLEETIIPLGNIYEQEKIGSFFYTLDKKLDLQKQKIEELKTYKKGMMQRIFSQEIRFKDENGQDYPDWEEKRLGQISKITTGKLDANAMVDNGKYRFYTCAKEYYRIDNYAFDTEALLISGNGANVGYIHYYNGKFNAYQRTYVLDSFKEYIIYIKYFLNANLKKRIDQTKNAGNTPYITLGTLSDMRISLPSLPEQKKIASFLSNLDRRIELEEERLESYEEFKKGLMQRMFV